ncbi:YlcG family protein [Erwiniaceae bacterium L1_55_4]|nr:YlcG family protein [Erwiniaceae bacterium L1_55_4]
MIADYLRDKWRFLRMYRARNTFPVDYRIIKNTAKIMGAHHASTRA